MRLFLGAVFAAFALCGESAGAYPPYVYESALQWSDATVKTDIPMDQRIYILGPEKVTEDYQLNNKTATHTVEVRQAIRATPGLTLGQALRGVPLNKSKTFSVALYRKLDTKTLNTITPFLIVPSLTASSSDVVLQPRDVILVRYDFVGGTIIE